MKSLIFGTAGIPISIEPRDTLNGIANVKKLGLGAMELEFVRQVNIKKEKTEEVKKVTKMNDVILTCHGQYYINLNSQERGKQKASIYRILNAARIADMCGAFSVTFHSAYYMNISSEKVYLKVKESLKHIVETLKSEGHKIRISPETTGKATQFGTVEEIVKLSQEIEQVGICVDFAHLFARDIGKFNSESDFRKTLNLIEKSLGKEALKSIHIHMSGMNYGAKGERNHLNMKDEGNQFNYKGVLKVLKEYHAAGVVISESPNIEGDAVLMKKCYEGV